MLGRTLISATVTLLIGFLASASALAQNLEAGKTPSQIFAGTCTACHKSPRGLLRTVPPGSLPGFLRQHYTTSSEMAGLLAGYLVSNGAADTRYQTKPDGRQGASPDQLDRQGRRLRAAPSSESGKPGSEPAANGTAPQGGQEPRGRNVRRPARPTEETSKPAEGEAARVAGERGPEGRKPNAKRRLMGRHGNKPDAEEPPKGDAGNNDASKTNSSKTDATKEESGRSDKPTSETSGTEAVKPVNRPTDERKPESSKSESSKSDSSSPEGSKAEPPADNSAPMAPRADTVTPAKTPSSDNAATPAGKNESAAAPREPAPVVTPTPAGSPAPPLSK